MTRSVFSNTTTFFSVEIINICTACAWPVQDNTPPGVRVDRGLRLFPTLGMCSSPLFSMLTTQAGVSHQETRISGTGSTGAASLVINETSHPKEAPSADTRASGLQEVHTAISKPNALQPPEHVLTSSRRKTESSYPQVL